MIKAIVYHTNTGHTYTYAQILSKKLNIPFYSLKEAKEKLKKEDPIIFLSWICAGKISKLKKANKNFQIKYIGAVGAYPKTTKYLEELKINNQIILPCFYLRGGIDYHKLKGIFKIIVKMVGKTIPKENTELSKLFTNGGNFVKEQNLEELIKAVKNEGDKNNE